MKINFGAYDRHREGFIMASIFGFKTEIKTAQKELKKKSRIHMNYSSYEVDPKSIVVETATVPESDYSHMIVYRKDVIEEWNTGPHLTFFTFQILDQSEPWDFYDKVFPQSFKDIMYDKLYNLSPAPILKEWTDYLISYFIDSGYTQEATTMLSDNNKRFRVTVTNISLDNLIFRIRDGLSHGLISLPGETSEFMSEIKGIDAYLHNFTDTLTKKIQESFRPLFIPQQDIYSEDLKIIADYMKWSDGISLYPAQKDIAQAVSNALDTKKCCFIVGEMGVNLYRPRLIVI